MRKPYFVSAVILFLLSWIVLYLSPVSKDILQRMLDNSDLLFPFSLYNGSQAAHPVWVFGGYTPFMELGLGYLLWLPFKNIALTFVLFAVLQPVLVVLCLLDLIRRVVGKNLKITSLVLCFSALVNLVSASGMIQSLSSQYFWYMHVTTAALVLVALGLLIEFSTSSPAQNKSYRLILLKLGVICVVAVMSDALFISQLVLPALILLIGMSIFSFIPLRWAALAILSLLGSTLIGVALYRIPALWGSQRMVLEGFYLHTDSDWVLKNIQAVFNVISSAWEGQLPIIILWVLFYILCVILAIASGRRWMLNKQGSIRKRLILCLAFFPLQLTTSFSAGLISAEPVLRYFLPLVFIPLVWGWPVLAIYSPFWMKFLRSRLVFYSAPVLSGVAFILLAVCISSPSWLSRLVDYYPQEIQCIDQNAARLKLHTGIAQYWLARGFTLFSRAGLNIVQVMPDLSPFPVLTEIQAYDQDFEFVIVETGNLSISSINRGRVIQRFGEPATVFTCGNLEALVYNRTSDFAFAHQFYGFINSGN